jgi:hypothetical protein
VRGEMLAVDLEFCGDLADRAALSGHAEERRVELGELLGAELADGAPREAHEAPPSRHETAPRTRPWDAGAPMSTSEAPGAAQAGAEGPRVGSGARRAATPGGTPRPLR